MTMSYHRFKKVTYLPRRPTGRVKLGNWLVLPGTICKHDGEVIYAPPAKIALQKVTTEDVATLATYTGVFPKVGDFLPNFFVGKSD